jgi:alkaline phosphatase D
MTLFTRRTIIAAPALLTLAARGWAAGGDYPFKLGVASGDPSSDGMVLWTRLAPSPLDPDGGMGNRKVAVHWELAADEHFTHLLRNGEAIAEPAWGHSVHVEPRGLAPDRHYYYRFIAGGETSPIGRTRTAPAPGAIPDRLRFTFCSCQKFEPGYYAAYRHMVEDDPDLIFFLGDYIYEKGAEGDQNVRFHSLSEARDVPSYRQRYALYKLDPLLQAAHHLAPWATTWDDHEVANDYDLFLDEFNSDPAAFVKRRAAAYHVYWENMPLRMASRPDANGATQLYRTLDWGGLAQFQIIDDRQYRGPRACQPPELVAKHIDYVKLVQDCPDLHADRTMLGRTQEKWLAGALGRTRAKWNVIAQQTIMSSLKRVNPADEKGPIVYSADVWAGYPVARDRILSTWRDAKTPNPFAIGGDIHSFEAADMRLSPDGPPVGAEFVGGSVTSLFHDPYLKQEAKRSGVLYAENEVRGYGRVDVTAKQAQITFRGLANALREDSPISDIAHFTIEAGRAGIQV